MRVRFPVTRPVVDAAARQTIKQHAGAGADFGPQVRTAARVNSLRVFHHRGHLRRMRARDAPALASICVRISPSSMPCVGHIIGCGFEPGGAADGFHQRLAMMRTGATQQSPVYIK